MTLLAGCSPAPRPSAAAGRPSTGIPTQRTTSPRTQPGATNTGAGSPSSPSNSPTAPPTTATGSPTATHSPASGTATNTATPVVSAPEYYVHAGPKTIALTVDDGPSSQYTPQILEILADHGVLATFCMIGRQIAENTAIVKDVAAAGHTIANHTWNHADQTKLSYSAIVTQIERTNDALNAVGTTPSVYRAPYGNWSHDVFAACAAYGLRPLDWSVDPRDWARPGVQSIVSNILSHTRTGSIILDHDGGGDRSQTVAAMRIWLPHLLAEGYRFTHV